MTVRWTVRADGDQGAQFAPRPSPIQVANLICGFSSFGRAPPCQGGGGGFEPRNPLQKKNRTQSGTVFLLDGRGFCAPKRRLALEFACQTRRVVLHQSKTTQRNTAPSFPKNNMFILDPCGLLFLLDERGFCAPKRRLALEFALFVAFVVFFMI